ncbi:MAG TPA: ATP-binding cassette domain-containing protein [Polyangiaceae bacterium]|jgi:ABC-type multidrug transport system ATPase subunit
MKSALKDPVGRLLAATWQHVLPLGCLQLARLMVLPLVVWLLGEGTRSFALGILALGGVIELARLLVQHRARRKLRAEFMAHATSYALSESSLAPEARADSAFWNAQISEYVVCIDIPAIFGAALAALLTLGLAISRAGTSLVLECAGVGCAAIFLGLVLAQTRRKRVDEIVQRRQVVATWLAAAARDAGEIGSSHSLASLSRSITEASGRWATAETLLERRRVLHRGAIVLLAAAALYLIARQYGIDPLDPGFAPSYGSLTSALLLGTCLPAVYATAVHLDSLTIARRELARLSSAISSPRERAGARLTDAPRTFEARKVRVVYGTNCALQIDEITLPLTNAVCIAGPNGSGKTTLATLIAGIREPSEGRALLDTVDAYDISRDDVAFVPQDPVLVEGLSIAENLALVSPTSDAKAMQTTLERLGLVRPLETNTAHLSRGERRRVAIARALLKSPRLLVLDEPEAWLDSDGRALLVELLLEASNTAAVVVVSHRPEFLLRLPCVLVLSADHRVAALGAPAALRETSPEFRALLSESPS